MQHLQRLVTCDRFNRFPKKDLTGGIANIGIRANRSPQTSIQLPFRASIWPNRKSKTMTLLGRSFLLWLLSLMITACGAALASPQIAITKAIYGAPGQTADVTAILAKAVAAGTFVITVDNDTLGGDPAPNVSKTLNLELSIDGVPKKVNVAEGDTINLQTAVATTGTSTAPADLVVPPDALAAVKRWRLDGTN